MKRRVILIAGPTASGKSGLALRLARRFGGAIVNADSMQVYADLSVLTARPPPAELEAVSHHLYGHVDGAEAYSAGRFAREAGAVIADIWAGGGLAIVTGGTGLYFKALVDGLSPMPAVPEAIRDHWRREAGRVGADRLHHLLVARDPLMAGRLRPSDPQRVTRALEVLEATGRSLASWQAEPRIPVLVSAERLGLVVSPDREALAAAIERRFDAMMEAGALDEVARLSARDLPPELPVMRALGVRPLARHLAGELPLAAAAAEAKRETRQFAKRQVTWTNSNMNAWKRINTQEMESLEAIVASFIVS